MNIPSVSSISNNSYSSGNDSDEKQLLNQVKQLQANTEMQNKDDDKTKLQKIQLLQNQILQIQAQFSLSQ